MKAFRLLLCSKETEQADNLHCDCYVQSTVQIIPFVQCLELYTRFGLVSSPDFYSTALSNALK